MTQSNDVGSAKTLVAETERVSLGRSEDEALAEAPVERRYRKVSPLGAGGMGEVDLVRDNVIGRDVALKRIQGERIDARTRDRFFREARVQGQLEHPSIVPVYDLGLGPDHRPFFTMQRVRGRTLDACTVGANALSRHAILAAMSRVCLAVDFAHSRGVVHRDLKPANVMIGDYGEVYVLDWGLARLHATDDEELPESASGGQRVSSGSRRTEVGAVLGTPGYMAPEQARGEPAGVPADIFALGACLFEVLAGVPVFPGTDATALLALTVLGADTRMSVRAPERDIPVELEAICARSLAPKPEERFESARAMSEAIERFLEGDRDLERRRNLAQQHAENASKLAASAFGTTNDDEARLRSDAMREVGSALAHDPNNAAAKRVMVRLLTEPPRTIPADVAAHTASEREKSVDVARRLGAWSLFIVFLPIGLLLWMGIREWFWLGLTSVSVLSSTILMVRPIPIRALNRYIVILGATLALIGASRVVGPFIVLPTMAMGLSVGTVLFPRVTHNVVAIAAGLVGILVPYALEWVGILPRSMRFVGGVIEILPNSASFSEIPTVAYILFGSTVPLVAVCVYLTRIRDRLRDAEERLRLQAWQLRQILPKEESGV